MKLTLESKTLNRLISRAFINRGKNTMSRLFRIQSSDEGTFQISVNHNFECYAVVGMSALVEESGSAYVFAKDFADAAKKMTDSVKITEDEKKLTLSCPGKSVVIWKVENEKINIPAADGEIEDLFTFPAPDLLETVKRLDVIPDFEDVRAAMRGICIDMGKRMIVACDGNHLGIRKIPQDWIEGKSSAEFVTGPYFASDLARVMMGCGKKYDESVRVTAFKIGNRNYLRCDGDDFSFFHRCEDVEYMHFERIIPQKEFAAVRFTVPGAEELISAATECAKLGGRKGGGMLMAASGDNLNACYFDERGDDKIGYRLGEIEWNPYAENPKNWIYGFNATFVKNGAELFGDSEKIEICFNMNDPRFPEVFSNLTPFLMEDENWIALIMPVRCFTYSIRTDYDGNEIVNPDEKREAEESRTRWTEVLRNL